MSNMPIHDQLLQRQIPGSQQKLRTEGRSLHQASFTFCGQEQAQGWREIRTGILGSSVLVFFAKWVSLSCGLFNQSFPHSTLGGIILFWGMGFPITLGPWEATCNSTHSMPTDHAHQEWVRHRQMTSTGTKMSSVDSNCLVCMLFF